MSDPTSRSQGYGNIYTPHAGSMIIQVQRESGLANRTIILTQRQVRLLRLGLYIGAALLTVGSISWVYLAAQAARVPFLTNRVAGLTKEVKQLDTLQLRLAEMERRLAGVARLVVIETAGRPDYLRTRRFYESRGYGAVATVPDFYAPGDDQVVYVKRVSG